MKKYKLLDITWAYSIDYQTAIPLVINHTENKFVDLRTNIVHSIPEKTTLSKAIEQIYTIENVNICSCVNMLNEFAPPTLSNLIVSPTIRGLEFGDQTTYKYCKTHKVNRAEIISLSKVFKRALRAEKQRLKIIEKQKLEEDIKSF